MFTQTAETLSKASTMVFRIGTDAHLYDDPDDVSIVPLLDSKYDPEKCEALKRLLALIAQGFDVSNYFPQVVKNVASQSLEVKKLVYLYLLHYAEKRPNEALLSINSFQRDLGDPNPLVRAWAMRTMAGIRLHMIAPIVLLAVGKCARDPSVYVRKCAANALPKLHDLRLEELSSSVEEIVGILLNDHSPVVVGAAASAFASVCPANYSLIAKSYQRLCEVLPDVEEWGQISLIGILLHYAIARHGLVKESIMSTLHAEGSSDSETTCSDLENGASDTIDHYYSELASLVSRSYIEGPDDYLSRSVSSKDASASITGAKFTSGRSNDDVKILLRCTSPLLWSHNSAVVLASAGVHWIMAPKEDVKRIVKPLLFLLRSSDTSKYVILCNIQVFAKAAPSLFAQHFEDFFISSSDSYQIKNLKLGILSSIATDSSITLIFKEFQDYVRDTDRRFAADTVAAMGICAQRLPKMASTCLEGLLAITRYGFSSAEFGSADLEADVLIQTMLSIKSIVEMDPPGHEKVVIHLIRSLDTIKVPAVRAIIIWIMGEYNNLGKIIPRMLGTVLRYLAWSFTSENSETKLQILSSVMKVLLGGNGEDICTLKQVVSYVLELAENDMNFDVRDRARFVRKLWSCNLVYQEPEEDKNHIHQDDEQLRILVESMFRQQIKQCSREPVDYRTYLPGTLSQIVLHAAPGYEPLPKAFSGRFTDLTGEAEGTEESDSSSGSLDDGSASDYSSEHSENVSSDGIDREEIVSTSGGDNNDDFIQISDAADASQFQNGVSQFDPASSGELISKASLESWLDEQPNLPATSASERGQRHGSSARIFIGDIGSRVTPKMYRLLDPANGNGLKVDYSFSSDVSSLSSLLIGLELSFENCSAETISELNVTAEELTKSPDSIESSTDNSVPILVPMEEITSLDPGQVMKRVVHVHFHHHLLPLKLSLHFNGTALPVKLRPDIGYFVRPLPMDIKAFMDKESSLPGMFEYTRSCTFNDHIAELNQDKGDSKDKFLVICESLALKMLSNANLFLVSVDMPIGAKLDDASGLCLRFSSEILSNLLACIVTITAEGKCAEPLNMLVKVNCEETVFGLNLLNRIVNVLSAQV